MKERKYYNYISYYRGIPVYVGKGTEKRWKHTVSGGSGSELLNEFYFRHKFFNDLNLETYVVERFVDNASATKGEKKLISKYLPMCNKCSGREHSIDKDMLGKISNICKISGFDSPELLESKFDFRFLFTPKGLMCRYIKLSDNSPFEYGDQEYFIKIKKDFYIHFPEYALQFIKLADPLEIEMFSAFTSKRIILGMVERGDERPLSHVTDDVDWLVTAYKGESFSFSDHLFKNPHQFDEEAFRTLEKGEFDE